MGLCCSNQRNHTPDFIIKRKILINNTSILIVQGDIAYDTADIIVNSTNSRLNMGGITGSGSILRHGGIQIQRECNEYLHKKISKHTKPIRKRSWSRSLVKSDMSDIKTGLDIGDVIVTSPGHLSCNQLFHAVGPIYADGKQGESDLLEKTIHNVLNKAVKMKAKSISLPAVSCGIFNFPREKCAEIMLQVILEHVMEGNSTLRMIRLVNQDTPTILYFEKEYDQILKLDTQISLDRLKCLYRDKYQSNN